MPRPKDTGLGSSGYKSEFYEQNTDKKRGSNASHVKPNTKAYKMQYGVSGPDQRVLEAKNTALRLGGIVSGRIPVPHKDDDFSTRISDVMEFTDAADRYKRILKEETDRKSAAERRIPVPVLKATPKTSTGNNTAVTKTTPKVAAKTASSSKSAQKPLAKPASNSKSAPAKKK